MKKTIGLGLYALGFLGLIVIYLVPENQLFLAGISGITAGTGIINMVFGE